MTQIQEGSLNPDFMRETGGRGSPPNIFQGASCSSGKPGGSADFTK